MSIDIKSLRIGSHVLMDGVRAKVMRLNTVKYSEVETFHILVRGVSPDTGAVGECGCFADDKAVQPIPITPGLLNELGFKSKREGCWQHWWKDGFDLQHRDNSEYWHFRGDIGVEYLHELEALYYMIYGVELIKE